MSSRRTGAPVSAKRDGSPLALITTPAHWAERHASTRSRIVAPPIRIEALSPPPMRRARPPASTSPRVGGIGGSVVMHGSFAPIFRALLLQIGEVLVEDDAVLARKRQ